MKKFLLLGFCFVGTISLLGGSVWAVDVGKAGEVKKTEDEWADTRGEQEQSIEDLKAELRTILDGTTELKGKEKWDREDELRKALEEAGIKGARIPMISNAGILPGPSGIDVV